MKWMFKIVGGALLVCLAILLFGGVTMYLWNWLMPTLFNLPVITFKMAIGLIILSKLLFGGMRMGHGGGWWGRRAYWKAKMSNMTPEEREKFKTEFADRCRHRWGGSWGSSEPKAEKAE